MNSKISEIKKLLVDKNPAEAKKLMQKLKDAELQTAQAELISYLERQNSEATTRIQQLQKDTRALQQANSTAQNTSELIEYLSKNTTGLMASIVQELVRAQNDDNYAVNEDKINKLLRNYSGGSELAMENKNLLKQIDELTSYVDQKTKECSGLQQTNKNLTKQLTSIKIQQEQDNEAFQTLLQEKEHALQEMTQQMDMLSSGDVMALRKQNENLQKQLRSRPSPSMGATPQGDLETENQELRDQLQMIEEQFDQILQEKVDEACAQVQEFFDQFIQQTVDEITGMKLSVQHLKNVHTDMQQFEELTELSSLVNAYIVQQQAKKQPVKNESALYMGEDQQSKIKDLEQQIIAARVANDTELRTLRSQHEDEMRNLKRDYDQIIQDFEHQLGQGGAQQSDGSNVDGQEAKLHQAEARLAEMEKALHQANQEAREERQTSEKEIQRLQIELLEQQKNNQLLVARQRESSAKTDSKCPQCESLESDVQKVKREKQQLENQIADLWKKNKASNKAVKAEIEKFLPGVRSTLQAVRDLKRDLSGFKVAPAEVDPAVISRFRSQPCAQRDQPQTGSKPIEEQEMERMRLLLKERSERLEEIEKNYLVDSSEPKFISFYMERRVPRKDYFPSTQALETIRLNIVKDMRSKRLISGSFYQELVQLFELFEGFFRGEQIQNDFHMPQIREEIRPQVIKHYLRHTFDRGVELYLQQCIYLQFDKIKKMLSGYSHANKEIYFNLCCSVMLLVADEFEITEPPRAQSGRVVVFPMVSRGSLVINALQIPESELSQ